MAMLIPDKMDFKTKIVNGKRGTFHNDIWVDPSRRYNNYIYRHLTTEDT